MKVRYSTIDPDQNELDSLPWLSLFLRKGENMVRAAGLLDTGATANVLPYGLGVQLGAVWDTRKAAIQLAGNLGNMEGQPILAMGEIGGFPPVKLAFAWTHTDEIPLILGQMNFFMEFDVCFYRSRHEFEVKPASP